MLFAAVVIGMLILLWIWKVPLTGMVNSLEKEGSSPFEAYTFVGMLISGSAAVIYMIWQVL